MDKYIILIIMAFFISGCVNEDGRQQADRNYCPKKAVRSDHVSPSLPSEFKGIRYLVKVSSIGENGVCERNILVAPEHAAKFRDSILLGGDRGEWGGELVIRNSQKEDNVLLKENVVSIKVIEQNAYVFTGLSHLGSSYGAMYFVSDGPSPLLLSKFSAPPSDVSFGEKNQLKLRFDNPAASAADDTGAKDSKYLCFSLENAKKPIEVGCD